jgi:hypothetical protein
MSVSLMPLQRMGCDHRLWPLICRTNWFELGNRDGVPRSTARSWIRRGELSDNVRCPTTHPNQSTTVHIQGVIDYFNEVCFGQSAAAEGELLDARHRARAERVIANRSLALGSCVGRAPLSEVMSRRAA